MPDEVPPTSPQPPIEPPANPAPSSPGAAPPVSAREPHPLPHMEEEFGTAAKNLPPAKIISIGLAVVAVLAIIFAVAQRPHSSASGSIDNIVSVEVPNQNSVMVAVSVSIHNNGQKPFWIRNTKADLDTGGAQYSDEGLSAVDFDRYYQAFPTLKENSYPPLKRENMINIGGEMKGTIIVSFPVTPDQFANRRSLKITVQPYDQPVPLVLTK